MRSPRGQTTVPRYVLDGRRTTTLDAFLLEISRVLPDAAVCAGAGADLDVLGEVLRGYGPVPAPVRLVWAHAPTARAALGYPETVRRLTTQLRDCRPNVLIKTAWALRAALRGQGPTVYDWIVTRLGAHPNVMLVLDDGPGR